MDEKRFWSMMKARGNRLAVRPRRANTSPMASFRQAERMRLRGRESSKWFLRCTDGWRCIGTRTTACLLTLDMVGAQAIAGAGRLLSACLPRARARQSPLRNGGL